MSHYPPQGKEMSVLRKIDGKLKRMDKAWTRLRELGADGFLEDLHCDGFHWHIDLGHAIEGVRVNGRERTKTLATVMLGVRRIRAGIDTKRADIKKAMNDLTGLLGEIQDLMAPFDLCKRCKGQRGAKIPSKRSPRTVYSWEDCEACDGRGVVIRP